MTEPQTKYKHDYWPGIYMATMGPFISRFIMGSGELETIQEWLIMILAFIFAMFIGVIINRYTKSKPMIFKITLAFFLFVVPFLSYHFLIEKYFLK